ncbi:MAG TPA: TetR/AcrR family transcriptional regulator [Xanthobacteraceae bacterium]|nr:TetR/AcrR family transcriptional regulator [Xanthobacteraceae bacterium]
MTPRISTLELTPAQGLPPRQRILAAASDLFYRQGIRAVGVDAIAEAAGTNKMTLYRHFESKDALVAEYLRKLAGKSDEFWASLERDYPGKPRAQLSAWLEAAGRDANDPQGRGCALANAAVELAEKDHPARRVIEEHKRASRDRLAKLCADANLKQPELLADELFLLLEGARVCSQSIGTDSPCCRFVKMGETIVASHEN